MAKFVHLKLTGDAETFVREQLGRGINERDLFAKALFVLEEIAKTGRVALVKHEYAKPDSGVVEYFYALDARSQRGVKRADGEGAAAGLAEPANGSPSGYD